MRRRQFIAASVAPLLAGCDAMMSAFLGSGSSPTTPIVTVPVAPTAAGITFSDYAGLDLNTSRARFSRYPDPYGQGYETANPGARVRFATDSRVVRVRLQYTNLVTRMDTYNGVGVVLVNGSLYTTFDRAQGPAGPLTVLVDFGSVSMRTFDILMPYCASVDFIGIDIEAAATLQAPAARPAVRYVACGDSITHGFTASRGDLSWPQRLAALKGWQFINMGYGGHQALPLVVQAAAQLSPTVGTYLIGYNNFGAQTPLATFKANFKSSVQNWRAAAPAAKLYCITPLWTSNTNTLTIEQYRQQIRDGLSELADPLSILVEGLPLATNSVSAFPDGIHPNDSASAQVAGNLLPIVTL